ncbi:Serine/threonine-protein kinase [Diplodia seriata]|uniref:non-specific serine/threonine protein kinase n=1 Tax=Diplodia seriata TaxID=420778 RepID=A0A1S8BHI0_9PEZI|nr:Serine/threonine-protein kinase ppk19 [Diplodia seriata]
MGQGYSLTTLSAGAAGIDVPELADLTYEKSLGTARFMKTIRARHKDGLVVVKVVMKPFNMQLDEYVSGLLHERKLLADVPNALPYHRILETSTNGFLIRQYMHSSLYDRMSTRPFLENIEKKWLAFQLLCAVRDCHARNIYHGDIKTENILVTSWNWLYLSDFSSSFKPTYLPEDNPADFSFFFDTSGRRTCYLAPERFLSTGSQVDTSTKVNWAMDMFSVGCVIAELFLETPIFSLSQLFKYRSEEYDPFMTHLQKIEDVDIREMVSHMIKLDPNQRYSADECLNFWRNRAFPDYFFSFLHQYMYSMTDPSAGRGPVTAGAENLGEADDRIDKVYNDFDKITYFLGYPDDQDNQTPPNSKFTLRGNLFPLHIDIPNYRHQANSAHHTVDDGTLIFLTLVAASVRSTARATARIRACELLLAFAERVTDEAKLDRILPYLTVLLTDKTDLVRVSALRALTQVLALVSVVSPINAYVFPEYILPRLEPFLPGHKSSPNPLLRATYASCLATLATTASQFLDMMQALRADGSLPTNDPEAEEDSMSRSAYQTLYDISREDLVAKFEAQTKALLTDNDPSVRRAFLGSVSSLCVFFGSAKANDVILSHLNTYLNDRDWMLKCAFFETIVGVGTYVGGASLEEFILPLMVQALTDPEEFVVDRVLRSLSSMAQLGLFQRARIWELVDIVARLTMHPNIWIREAAAQFVSSATTYLSVADTHSIVLPLIRPYLKVLPSDLSELKLLDSLKKPLSRLVLDMAYTWATNTGKGVFWKSAQQQRTFSFGLSDDAIPSVSGRELGPKALARVPKNDEDEQWLKKLRNGGMGTDDEFKLLALREYIWRVSHRKKQDPTDTPQAKFNTILPLKDLGITPQTIFFDHKQSLFDEVVAERAAIDNAPHTIADALRDASTDDNIPRRRLPHMNHLERHGSAERPIPRSDSRIPGPSSPAQSPSDGPALRSIQIPKTRTMDSDALDSPASITSRAESRLGVHEHAMRHKSSAMSLMNNREGGNKALAEISTTSANAFGRVDSISTPKDEVPTRAKSPLALAQEQHRQDPDKIKFQAAHSYTGTDPTILKLLDSVYLENFPVDFIEFGPMVTPISKRQAIKRGNGQTSSSNWRPEGTLVAMLGEHTGAISRVLVSPDHAFFITGSDDGTVKVWDSSRLERNVSHKSRGTYKQGDGVKITSLCFIENTHCFVSTGNDGSVHVVKVDYNEVQNASGANTGIRYGKLKVLREHKLPQGQFAVWSHHYKLENQSVLLLATNTSQIHAIDLRSTTTLFTLSNPLHHGAPTCFVTDRKHHWLLLGTTHGVLDLWDLRFKMRLRAWCFPGGAPIHRITIQTVKMSRKPKFIIAGGTAAADITVWDLEKLICTSALRTSVFKETSTNRHYTLIDLDDDLHQRSGAGGSNTHGPSGMLLGRFAASIESSSVGHGGGTDRSVRALALGSDDGNDFLVSAGSDWKVRFWDLARPEASNVVSGLEMEESRPVYTVLPPAAPNPETTIVQERIFRPSQQGTGPESNGDSGKGKSAAGTKTASPAKRGREATGARGGRDTLRSLQQQQLLKGHLDNVSDVAVLEQPYGMVVSVDRAGVIMVFQ